VCTVLRVRGVGKVHSSKICFSRRDLRAYATRSTPPAMPRLATLVSGVMSGMGLPHGAAQGETGGGVARRHWSWHERWWQSSMSYWQRRERAHARQIRSKWSIFAASCEGSCQRWQNVRLLVRLVRARRLEVWRRAQNYRREFWAAETMRALH